MKAQLALIVGATLLIFTAAVYAHHPFSAEYDWTKPVTLTGTVTKLEWSNPHAFLHINGKDDKGQTKEWTLEMGSPAALTRAGWTRTTVKMGDEVTVEAWLAKTAPDRANVKSVKLANGKELSGGSSILDTQRTKTTKPISN
jgi:Family of unknown function (DUF6152)